MDDVDLLKDFAQGRSEGAFAALFQRHGGQVYAAAMRQVKDPHLAEDVTQAVFLALAQKAPRLSRGVVLSGWLYSAARFASLHLLRTEGRRREREQMAMAASDDVVSPEPWAIEEEGGSWAAAAPLLDEAMASLPGGDRDALLIRFWEQQSLRVVGERLGLSEEAAKKRVSRGVEKLRKYFRRRGIAVAAGTVTGWLEASAQVPTEPTMFNRILESARSANLPATGNVAGALNAIGHGFRQAAWASAAPAAGVLFATAVVILSFNPSVLDMKSILTRTMLLFSAWLSVDSSATKAGELVDRTFAPAFSRHGEQISRLIPLPDGRVMAWGLFDLLEDVPAPGLARLNEAGEVDTGFRARSKPGELLGVQPDGAVLVRGPKGLARLTPDGSWDGSFDLGAGLSMTGASGGFAPEYLVRSLVIDPDGRIVLAGYFTEVNGVRRVGVARLNRNGSVDSTFDATATLGPDPNDPSAVPLDLMGVAVQPDGHVVVVGNFERIRGRTVNGIVRFRSDGTWDEGFQTGSGSTQPGASPGTRSGAPIHQVRSVGSGDLILAGGFTEFNGEVRPGLVRLRADGSVDDGFRPVAIGASLMDVQADGKVLVGFFANGTVRRLGLDGANDPTFRWSLPGLSSGSFVGAVAALPDGRVIASQSTGEIPGNATTLKWVTTNGVVQAGHSVVGRLAQRVRAIVPQADGKLIVGGEFGRVNGRDWGALVRLNPDGSVDETFRGSLKSSASAGGAPVNPSVWHALPQTDGRIVISGFFEAVERQARGFLARLNPDGSLDRGYAPLVTMPDYTAAYALQADNRLILASRSLTRVGAVPRRGIARLNSDGSLDAGFDPGSGIRFGNLDMYSIEAIRAIAVQSDGRILLAGALQEVGGLARTNLARLSPDGAVDPAYDPGKGILGEVLALSLQSDDRLILGGSFTQVGGLTQAALARLNVDGTLDPKFQPKLTRDEAGASVRVHAIRTLPDGRILVGGDFSAVDGVRREGVARLHPDGSVDATWDLGDRIQFGSPVGIPDVADRRMIFQVLSDQSLLIGGSFVAGDAVGLIRVLPRVEGRLALIRKNLTEPSLALMIFGGSDDLTRIEHSEDLIHWLTWTNVSVGSREVPVGGPSGRMPAQRFFRVVGDNPIH